MLMRQDEFEVTDDMIIADAEDVSPTLEDKVDELLSILRPMREVIESLPAAMEQVTPLIDGLRNSPVVKMLGIKIP